MAQLLDLSDELILIIADYLQTQKGHPNLPFYKLADSYERAIKREQPQENKDLRSLYLVSRRFYKLLKRQYYENLCVREDQLHHHPLDRLKRTLRDEPNLQKFIVSAIVPCKTSLYDFFGFYWFPKIQALSILCFNTMDPLEDKSSLRQFAGKSPVKDLNLIRCGAHEEPLAAILSWPTALETLHYDVEQGEWDGFNDEPERCWTAAAFVRTLQPQKASLKELTITRPWLDHEGLFNGPRIDLSDFTALTKLRIYHVFLCGHDDPLDAWRSLPRSLEELDIFYDDTDLTTFEEDEFLSGLLVHKEEHLPHLRKISIASPETIWHDEKEEPKPAGRWLPPPPLAQALETAGLDLDVQLGVQTALL